LLFVFFIKSDICINSPVIISLYDVGQHVVCVLSITVAKSQMLYSYVIFHSLTTFVCYICRWQDACYNSPDTARVMSYCLPHDKIQGSGR